MTNLMQDVRYAIRTLAQAPGFTLVAVVTLALGIGANTAVFSLVDTLLFRPLAIAEPERVVRVFASDRQHKDLSNSSYPVFTDYRDQSDAFAELSAVADSEPLHISTGGQTAERVTGALVSGNYFQMLGVRPALGRFFTAEDDRNLGAHPVAVLSHRLWQRMGGNRDVIGSTLRVNGHVFNLVGVARPDFCGANYDSFPELWLPMAMTEVAEPEYASDHPLSNRQFSWIDIVGRLKPGVSIAQAQAQLDVIAANRAATQKKGQEEPWATLMPVTQTAINWGQDDTVQRVGRVLLGVAALVLGIALAVAAGLLLVRGERRQREVAIRLAIGASRGRIVRQLLVESLLLSFAGAAAGLLLAAWSTDALLQLIPPTFPLPVQTVSSVLDQRVLGFTTAVAVMVGLLFGLLPALRASRPELIPALKAEAFTPPAHRAFNLRTAFVVAQVALCVVVLVGAGLLLRTVWKASTVALGFAPEGKLLVSLDVARQGYSQERGAAFYSELLERVRRAPGVEAAALGNVVPVQSSGMRTSVEIEGFQPPPGEYVNVDLAMVSPGYFSALGVPVLRGRDFGAADNQSAPLVAVINQELADRYLKGRDPLGAKLGGLGPKGEAAVVIGVVATTKLRSVREAPRAKMFVPHAQSYMPRMTVIARTSGEPRALRSSIAAVAAGMDKDMPLFNVRTLREHVGRALAQERIVAGLLSAYGLVALLLAAFGLYGVVSYASETRTREFGIRMALGAQPGDVARLVVRQAALVTLAGTLVGIAGALASASVVEKLLFGVPPRDPLTLTLVPAVLGVVALLACYLPARRAARVDPMVALRYE